MSWYYHDGTNPVGPVEDSQVIEFIKNGTIKRDTPVWKEGLPDWCRASTTEFAQSFAKMPPPMMLPPPMAPTLPQSGNLKKETTEERIEKLERELAEMKAELMKVQTQEIVKAKEFIVVDDQGKTRVKLNVSAVEGPGLWIYDENAKIRAMLGGADDVGLALLDENQNPQILMHGEHLSLGDPGGSNIKLTATDKGAELSMRDETSQERIILKAAKEAVEVCLCDNGPLKMRGRFVATDDETELGLYDGDGDMVWSAP